MLQAIALAIRCFICFEIENLTERFICLVLEEIALAGNLAEQAIGYQLLARAGLIQESRPQIFGTAKLVGVYMLIGLCGL